MLGAPLPLLRAVWHPAVSPVLRLPVVGGEGGRERLQYPRRLRHRRQLCFQNRVPPAKGAKSSARRLSATVMPRLVDIRLAQLVQQLNDPEAVAGSPALQSAAAAAGKLGDDLGLEDLRKIGIPSKNSRGAC